MSSTFRETTWRAIVIRADPEWPRESAIVPEYEFSAGRSLRRQTEGAFRDYADGQLIFKGDYRNRGAYDG